MFFLCRVIFLFFILSTKLWCAIQTEQTITLELRQMNLPDAIRLVAKSLQMNVIVSQAVSGQVSLQLQEASSRHAFDLLLSLHGLGKYQMGNVWVIAPQAELIKRKQEEIKWQETLEASEILRSEVWQLQYAKVAQVAKLFSRDGKTFLSKRGRIEFDERSNLIYIYDTSSKMKEVKRWLHALDVAQPQILIEARLASVDHDAERELGIDFTVKSALLDGTTKHNNRTDESGHYSIAVAKLADGSLLDVRLAALEKKGLAELISSPSLFTANQQMASIEAGEEVPYQEVSESGGTAVAFKKAVLGLTVTPQILPGNKVLLQLKINQDRPSNKMIQGVPTISTRQMMTNVLIKSGQTIVLGGIYETMEEKGVRRLPFLSDIPGLGWLFQQEKTQKNKRELLIFVTPRIITQQHETRTY